MADVALDPKARMEPKDPSALLIPYGIDWTSAIPTGDTISLSTWSVTPSGLTFPNSSINGAVTSVQVSGGTADVDYLVTNEITTNNGYRDQRTILIPCRER